MVNYLLVTFGHQTQTKTRKVMKTDSWIDSGIEQPEIAKIVSVMVNPEGCKMTGFRANGGWYVLVFNQKVWIANGSEIKITHWKEKE